MAPDGKRKRIRLGKVPQRSAEGFKYRVERLLETKQTGQPLDSDTATWVASLDDGMSDKLARVGLIVARERQAATSGAFTESYIVERKDAKPATVATRR